MRVVGLAHRESGRLAGRESLMKLAAGGGFVPQSLIDSSEVTDPMMVVNAEKG